MNEGAICRKLKVGCLNTRSICNKTCGVLELLKENSIDLCCVTETWLNMKDVAKFAEIHDHGYDLFSAPRRGRGGGVAFIFGDKAEASKMANFLKKKGALGKVVPLRRDSKRTIVSLKTK